MKTIFVVATPIGNLKDISLRALDVLKKVDFILAEDTRKTKRLLKEYKIDKKLISFHQHSDEKKLAYIISLLESGKDLALVSNSGTPCISDPGSKLVCEAIAKVAKIKIVPIPGPSALIAGASVSGFQMNRFLFLGFLPKKKRRKKFINLIAETEFPIIIYESPYRILKTLKDLPKDREIVVCRELTKLYETIYRGKVKEIKEILEKEKLKGEFVIIIGPKLKNKKGRIKNNYEK